MSFTQLRELTVDSASFGLVGSGSLSRASATVTLSLVRVEGDRPVFLGDRLVPLGKITSQTVSDTALTFSLITSRFCLL